MPIFVKPENALKRSEELLSLGTPQSQQQAFENLVEVFQSKRFKHTPINVLEPIMAKFIDLCVTMNRKAHARAALLTFRNAVQSTSIQSLENILNHFIARAEERLAAATTQAQSEVAALPETPLVDDELPLQPTSLLLDTFVDNAGDRERIERRLIAPAQKFCWDAYDISLDVAKGNSRLEVIYQSIAHRAFKFCKTHQRKTDFRRLCEQRLRKDLTNALKYAHQPHSVNLADPETLTRHLDTRFLQLETAVELELWQEAFRSVEDVHGLVAGKKSAKPSMMANYYEKLTQIFNAEGGRQTAVFHAAAWARYIQYAERAGSVPEKAPGCVLLSALAVPLGDVESKQRLVALLNLPKMPTRDALVKDAASKHLRRVPTEIKQIYNILEIDFQPLKAAKQLAPLITSLGKEYQPYLPALREVILTKLLQDLSQLYDTVTLAHVLNLVKPFDSTPWSTDMPSLEKFLMSACRSGEITASVDHVAKSITFTAKTHNVNRLSNLAVCLYNTIRYLEPIPTTSRADAFAAAIGQAEEERKAVQVKRQIVAKRRELLEEANIRREREESTAKAEKAKQLAEENARREKELARQNEKAMLQRQMDQTRREEARKLAESLAATGSLKVDMSKIDDLDSNEVLALQVQQMDKEKRELNDRLRIVAKRVDHMERAMRKEERPLLTEDYERQKEEDKKAHEKAQVDARQSAVEHQAAMVDLKKRLGRMMPDYLEARKTVESQREAEFEQARKAAAKKIETEKAKFKAQVLARRKKEREAREQERQRQEEEERIEAERAEEEARFAAEAEEREATQRAEAEKAKAEAAEKAAAARAEREAERAAAAEAAKRQMEREAEAERRRAERASGAGAPRRPEIPISRPSPVSAAPSPLAAAGAVKPGGWRDRVAAKEAGGAASPAVAAPAVNTPPAVASPPAVNGTASPTTEAPKTEGVFRPGQGRWTSNRGRGSATGGNTPPSTRGGMGGKW